MPVFPVPLQRRSLASAGLLCLAASLLLPSKAEAQFITNSPDPFQGSMLTLQAPAPEPYPPLGFTQTLAVTNIAETNNTIVSGNDVIDYDALLNATFYTTPALTTVAANVTLAGSFQVMLLGRTSPFQTGTFDYQITSIDFSGTIMGHTLQAQLNPNFISQGTTTITPGPGVGEFTVTAPAVLYGQRIIDGGDPINGPPFTVTVGPAPTTAVPEPGVFPMAALLGAGGLLTWRRARRRS